MPAEGRRGSQQTRTTRSKILGKAPSGPRPCTLRACVSTSEGIHIGASCHLVNESVETSPRSPCEAPAPL